MTGKDYRVLYKVQSGSSIHDIMREVMPDCLKLVTLAGEDKEELLGKLGDADFVIAVKLDAEMIGVARRLKLIQLAGVGFDGIDLKAATRSRIPVAQTVEGTIIGVAEHTILLILALYRRLIEADAGLRRGEWLVWQLRPESYMLYGKTVGIFGLGRIGREVANRCRAFGAEVLYHDPYRLEQSREAELGVRFIERDDLLRQSDVVTLHLPLSPDTRRFFGEREFRLMKPSAIFINTARGDVVDEEALICALRERWIAGAGLDVFEPEPPQQDNPLFGLKHTVLTPHCATGTRDSIIEKTRAACDNFLRVIGGERPHNVINPEVFAEREPLQ
jgi:phosphoglycerate dehydrogenase-like enzyme